MSIKGWRHYKFKERGSTLRMVGGAMATQHTAFDYRYRVSCVVQGANRREGRGLRGIIGGDAWEFL